MNNKQVFITLKCNHWIESVDNDFLASISLVQDSLMVDYRDTIFAQLKEVKVDLFGWRFPYEIQIKRSANFHDSIQLEFVIKCVNSDGKEFETLFCGNHVAHSETEGNSLAVSIFTAIYLIALCGNIEHAKIIYEKILTKPLRPYNSSALTPTYSRFLVSLLDCTVNVLIMRGSKKLSDSHARLFYEGIIENYNTRLYEYCENIFENREYCKLSIEN